MFFSESLPKAPTSAEAARRLLERVRDELPADVLDDASLLLSELVANAVEHVREEGEIEVRIAVRERTLRVEVLDPGPGFTWTRRTAEVGPSDRGWGLHFTDRVATRWAIDHVERARVWFELERA